MTNSRRKFINRLSALAGLSLSPYFIDSTQGKQLLRAFENLKDQSLEASILDESFWYQVKLAYTVSPTLVNLNNGGVSPSAKVVQDTLEYYNQKANESPSYFMWRILDKGREPIRASLAAMAGCTKEEIAINRNASEALETIIFGLPLKAGDEVVLSKQDYPNMIQAWKQRELRDGIVLKWINLELPSSDKKYLVNQFVDAFSPKTKLAQITHVINWIGQILPVKEIVAEAKKRGIETLVDGAHSFAHFQFSLKDLDCDYFGTSLHKWLCAPIGSGMLYIKKSKISGLYPLFAAPDPKSDNIRKFEHLGTRSFPIEQAIGKAIEFHNWIGVERKAKRLFYLKKYWVEKVKNIPGIEAQALLDPEYSGAIALVNINGMKPGELSRALLNKYQIHTTAINWENINGVRISPNVYTSTKDLDRLVEALKEIVSV